MLLSGMRATGARLAGIHCLTFPERAHPIFAVASELARALAEHAGRGADLESCQRETGNSFIAMSEALLAGLPGNLARQDVVMLAYHSPDLYRNEVAGCYLAQRLPGGPVPWSVTGQGPGGMFTALRIADSMCRLGELNRGVVFGYDQNATLWGPPGPAHAKPDAAVLLEFGSVGSGGSQGWQDRGGAVVERVVEVRAGPGGPSPAEILGVALGQSPAARAIVGLGLWSALDGAGRDAGRYDGDRVEPATDLWCLGTWAGLARLWPVTRPVLLADYDQVGRRVYTALLIPEDES
jgi:hypothetical protein